METKANAWESLGYVRGLNKENSNQESLELFVKFIQDYPVFAVKDVFYEAVALFSPRYKDNFLYTGESFSYFLQVPEEIRNIKKMTSPLPEK